jgi:hypothetical protein
MIKRSELLDPESTEDLSAKEKRIVADAQNAGRSLASSDPTKGDEALESPHNTGGMIEQTISSKAVAKFGKPGGESDISGTLPGSRNKSAADRK